MALTEEENKIELELIRRYEKKVEEQGGDEDLWEDNESEWECGHCGEECDHLINGICLECDELLWQ